MPDFRVIALKDVTLRIAIEGSGPLVVIVHGFPESWYSWRHQTASIAAAGFTACAIDVRGYGGSDRPHAIEAYSLEHLSNDMTRSFADIGTNSSVADAVGIGPADHLRSVGIKPVIDSTA